jgi:excinuclease ABC subunit A
VLKTADWIIDLGPEGGEKGGYVIAEGTPENLAANPASATGQYLREPLARGRRAQAASANGSRSRRAKVAV